MLVIALHKGEIDNFNQIVATYSSQYYAQPALAAKHEDVKKKVVLLCLLNIAFLKPSYNRNITFAEIAEKTRIPIDQVKSAACVWLPCVYVCVSVAHMCVNIRVWIYASMGMCMCVRLVRA